MVGIDNDFIRSVMMTIRDALIIMDDQGKVVYWNDSATALFGYQASEAFQRDMHSLIAPARYHEKAYPGVANYALSGEGPLIGQVAEVRALHKEGHEIPVELTISPVHSEGHWFAVGVVRDVRTRLADQQRISHDLALKLIIEKMQRLAQASRPLSDKFTEILQDVLALPWLPIQPRGAIFLRVEGEPRLRLVAQEGLHEAVTTSCAEVPFGHCICGRAAKSAEIIYVSEVDERHEVEYEGMLPHGHYCVPILDPQGEVLGVLNTYLKEGHLRSQDEERSLALIAGGLAGLIEQHRVARYLRRMEHVVEQSPLSIAVTDLQGRFEYVNPEFCRITGYAREELVGQTPALLKSGETRCEVYQQLWGAITSGKQWRGELLNRKKDGELFWESEIISPLTVTGKGVVAYVAIKEDVTEKKAQKAQMDHLRTHDLLTNAPNAVLLEDRLQQAYEHAIRNGQLGAVIFVDVARLASINEALGHQAGNGVIKEVVRRLRELVRRFDTVGRYSGDTLVVIATDLADQAAVATLCERIVVTFHDPFPSAKGFDVSCHIGVALFPQDGSDATTLLRCTDIALNAAKRGQLRNGCFYDDSLDDEVAHRVGLKHDLDWAIMDQQFELYYQPKVSLATGRIVAAEALIRWNHPERGLVSPLDFIGFAEESGQIIAIGQWVIDQTARDINAWQQADLPHLPISLNVSARQFADESLPERFAQAITCHGIPGHSLEMELTESVLVANPEGALKVLESIAALGVSISIDDFGTGYSSLSYIHRFPVDRLKIDRSFITDLTTNQSDAVIVRSTIAMCHQLGIGVVAEGVETLSQVNYLARLGCDEIQGYYFSKPVPEAAFRQMRQEKRCLENFSPESITGQRNLLILDDEPFVLSALKRVLASESYRLFTTASVGDALEIMASHAIGVVISDQRMPELMGTEFLAQIKVLHPDTIRIILSGYTELDSVLNAINRGEIFRYLTKPWDNAELKKNIAEAFNQYDLVFNNRRLSSELARISQEARSPRHSIEHVGVAFMDRDHEQLLDIFNQMVDIYYMQGNRPELIEPLVKELTRFAAAHFKREEQLMAEIGYAAAAAHRDAHQELLQEGIKLGEALLLHSEMAKVTELMAVLRGWLGHHVERFDQPLAEAKRDYDRKVAGEGT